MVSYPPLNSPFARTRLPSVARLNARGPQGRLVLKAHPLIEAELFRSGTLPPCTIWPRTVMRGKSRKLTSGARKRPKICPTNGTEPRNPPFRRATEGVAAQRRVWGVRRGQREPYGAPLPPCPLPPGGGNARPAHRQPLIACGGKPPERRNRLPSAEGIASKKRAFRLSLELEYDAREGAHADEHDGMHLRQLPDRDRNH